MSDFAGLSVPRLKNLFSKKRSSRLLVSHYTSRGAKKQALFPAFFSFVACNEFHAACRGDFWHSA